MGQLNDELLSEIQCELEGTCTTLTEIIERYGIDIDETALEDRLLDGPDAVERSACCEWWFRSGDLEFVDGHGALCEQCEPDAFPADQ